MNNTNKYWCNICYKIFFYFSIKKFEEHYSEVCSNYIYYHQNCFRKFKNKNALNRHNICFNDFNDYLMENEIHNFINFGPACPITEEIKVEDENSDYTICESST